MHSRRILRPALVVAALLAPAACSSSSSNTAATSAPSTSAAQSTAPTTSEATVTTTGGDAGTTTTKPSSGPTTTKPAANNGPQVTMSVTNPGSCPAVDATFKPELTITISWTVTNADSVTIAIDGPGAFEENLPLSGSMVRPWSCPADSHTYTVQAVKNGQIVAQKSKTVNPST